MNPKRRGSLLRGLAIAVLALFAFAVLLLAVVDPPESDSEPIHDTFVYTAEGRQVEADVLSDEDLYPSTKWTAADPSTNTLTLSSSPPRFPMLRIERDPEMRAFEVVVLETCAPPRYVAVTETAKSVTVEMIFEWNVVYDCGDAYYGAATVSLNSPLGDRALLRSPDGSEVELAEPGEDEWVNVQADL